RIVDDKFQAISQSHREHSEFYHPPRIVDGNRNDQGRWRVLAQKFQSGLLEFLWLPVLAARSFRENYSRSVILLDVLTQSRYYRNSLFGIFAINQNRTAMTQVERNARNSSSKFLLTDKFWMPTPHEPDNRNDIVHALMIRNDDERRALRNFFPT